MRHSTSPYRTIPCRHMPCPSKSTHSTTVQFRTRNPEFDILHCPASSPRTLHACHSIHPVASAHHNVRHPLITTSGIRSSQHQASAHHNITHLLITTSRICTSQHHASAHHNNTHPLITTTRIAHHNIKHLSTLNSQLSSLNSHLSSLTSHLSPLTSHLCCSQRSLHPRYQQLRKRE